MASIASMLSRVDETRADGKGPARLAAQGFPGITIPEYLT